MHHDIHYASDAITVVLIEVFISEQVPTISLRKSRNKSSGIHSIFGGKIDVEVLVFHTESFLLTFSVKVRISPFFMTDFFKISLFVDITNRCKM